MMLCVLATLSVATAQLRWRLIPTENKKEEETSTAVSAEKSAEKSSETSVLPSTLSQMIRSNRAFMQPQRTEETVQKLNVADEVKKASRSDETVIKREAPHTFDVDTPKSGMAYSSFSSSTSTRLVDGKWVTETTNTEVKPSGPDSRLRGTTTKEVKIEPAASEAASSASAATLFSSSASSSSSSSAATSASSSSSTGVPRSVIVISRGRPPQDDVSADPFGGDSIFSSPFSASPFSSLLRSFAQPNLFAAPAAPEAQVAPVAPRAQVLLVPRLSLFPLNFASAVQTAQEAPQAAQAAQPVQLRIRQVAPEQEERK